MTTRVTKKINSGPRTVWSGLTPLLSLGKFSELRVGAIFLLQLDLNHPEPLNQPMQF